MQIDDIKKVLVVGAGTMGYQIAWQCALSGYDVILFDLTRDILENAMRRIERLLQKKLSLEVISPQEAGRIRKRISTSIDPQEAGVCADLLSESIPEDPDLKSIIFAQFNIICPVHTIFTTNTSSLVPSMIAEATGRPAQFAALHFHDVRVSNVVDIMPHPGTSPETVECLRAFAERISQIAIVLQKEHPGYVFNTMLMALLKAAQTLAANGITSYQDIDRAWMGVMGTTIGPFGIMDSIGLDTVWKVLDFWAPHTGDPQDLINTDFLKQYVDRGAKGNKTGQGFYSYPNPAYMQKDFLLGKKA
ncbi:MAG: 3-hydroxyacyl-CoA dehydrogenase [Deltaproteobacteria bacterium]|nr:3-hydroxyacyl-CoA dehydrogenase [Deltaproteobacteria bacterium]